VNKISHINSLLKRLYRSYNQQLLTSLQDRGFTDLRASFLEVLLFICENEGPSIKEIGQACGLKKQTMTSHLNEMEKRGYIYRAVNSMDKREQRIFLTEYGIKFKFSLLEAVNEVEQSYADVVGSVEIDRVEHLLKNFHDKLQNTDKQASLF
jgi:DNA-binding MarR family transcriptional regulator